jgi:hypothetical protein
LADWLIALVGDGPEIPLEKLPNAAPVHCEKIHDAGFEDLLATCQQTDGFRKSLSMQKGANLVGVNLGLGA